MSVINQWTGMEWNGKRAILTSKNDTVVEINKI